MANIAVQQYSRLERGVCRPTLLTFFKLVKILDIPLSEFGIEVNNTDDENKKELVKEIYMLSEKEVKMCLAILKTVKNCK